VYSKMDWDEIEKHYKHFNDDWGHYPKRYCSDDQIPEVSLIRQEYQTSPDSEDKWKQSTHPFCKSCFAVYKNICANVGLVFGLSRGWNKDDLPGKVFEYIQTYSQIKPYDQLIVFERAIRPLAECILSRWFHHYTCYFSNIYNINHTIKVTNSSHEAFLFLLSKQINSLYKFYKMALQQVNALIELNNSETYSNTPLVEDMIVNEFPTLLNICRSLMKQLGNAEDKRNAERVFVTESTMLSNKSARKKDQSRVKSAYKIPKVFINHITQKYLSNEERNADDSKFRLSNKLSDETKLPPKKKKSN
jgi:hypothetical protein